MKALSESSKKYLIIGLAVLVIILSGVLIYVQASVLSDLRVEVEEEEFAVDLARSRLTRLIGHRENAAEYEQRLETATRLLPAQPGEDQILRYIHRLADDNGLRATDISFGNRSVDEEYTTIPLSISVEGSFQDTRNLLRQLRNGERAFRVDNLSVTRAGGEGALLRVSISANAFYNHNE